MRAGDDGPGDEDDDLLAGEYVLGVLTPEQDARLERRLREDGALAAAVRAWERRLDGLTEVAAPVAAPEALWRRIEAHLDGPRLVAPSRLARAADSWERLWESVALWRAATAAATAAALGLAVLLLLRGPGDEAAPAFVAVLQAPGEARPGYLVEVDVDRGLALVPLVRREVEEGRVLQFWTLIDPASGPVSLGLVPPGETVRLPAGVVPEVRSDQLFELTLEPSGGSPTGRPTGPIQFVGRAAARAG